MLLSFVALAAFRQQKARLSKGVSRCRRFVLLVNASFVPLASMVSPHLLLNLTPTLGVRNDVKEGFKANGMLGTRQVQGQSQIFKV
jgi:hypothetical protein